MSSSTWTPGGRSLEPRRAAGRCWRVVEAQNKVSTAKLTDSAAEQLVLERLIEESKPAVPEECRHLHFLLASPFRYTSPYPRGSRFRRAGPTPAVYYASHEVDTAIAEICFHRILFYLESPGTPFPENAGEHTAFAVDYRSRRAIDLTAPPLNAWANVWRHPADYAPCQALADTARDQGIEIVRYASVRDPRHRLNVALLTCRAFASPEPVAQQSWRILLDGNGARALCEMPRRTLEFDRAAFAADPRIREMKWQR
jgi:hypothetical protein